MGHDAMLLGPGREFDLIRTFFRQDDAGPRADVRLGAGDDAAVVAGNGIVLSSDLSVEDVHFRRDWLTPAEIGFRAAAGALSDLAAMAARPIGVLVSLALVPEDAERIAAEIMGGVTRAVAGVGGVLLGGDLTRSPGPIILDLVVVGEASEPVLRMGARAGDTVWVTGELGGAALAVADLARGVPPPPAARRRFAEPSPRTAEALWLADHGIPTAMIDLSDGLAGDATHIARASGVAVVLEVAALPIHPELAASGLDSDGVVRLALGGGEDYEICFTARPGAVERVRPEFEDRFAARLTCVGRIEEGEGVHRAAPQGGRSAIDFPGFQHFGGGG